MDSRTGYAGNGKDGPGAAAFRVQDQIRRNAQDMQEYLTDLGSWEKKMKKKDKQLSRRAKTASSVSHQRGTSDTPPIRPAGGTVPVSSGPAPQISRSSENRSENNAAVNHSGGVTTSRHGGMRARSGDGAASDLGKTKSGVSAAGHTYDKGYDKWAKFDVDAALRSVDGEDALMDDKRGAGEDSSSDSDTDGQETRGAPRLTPATMVGRSSSQGLRRLAPSQPIAAPPTKAQSKKSPRDSESEERERGNAKFGKGDFEGAVKSYTRCVGMNSKSSLAFSNRAMAYLKLKEFGKAEADCDAALRVEPRHVKSLQRRAVARNALGKHRAALGDLQAAAEIDPGSKQVRKDLSKTLETLKTVARRAPKRQVKVESAPLPAPKPRGYSSPRKNDEEVMNPRDTFPASPDPAVGSAVSTISTNAPTTGSKETIAPYSSVLRESTGTRANGESTALDSYAARTTVEELSEEVETPASLTSVAAGLPIAAPASGAVREVPTEATSAAATPPPEAKVGSDTGPAAVSTPPESGQRDVTTKHASREGASSDNFGGSDNSGSAPQEREAGFASLQAKTQVTETSQPEEKPQQKRPSAAARASGSTSRALQLPTTGYQFEHLWRSTDGSPEARIELLRAIPPSSVAKFFRRTPIEVDLLGDVLQNVGEAFLPKRPGTALRWLKSLSKASRFGMTVALLGETDGRAAAREVLTRLETAPPSKVDPQEIGVMRQMYLLC